MFTKRITTNFVVFLIVLCSLSIVESKKRHNQHHNTTTPNTPVTTIDEDLPKVHVKIKRIHFLHRDHKQALITTTLSPIGIDDQEGTNEET